MTRQLPADVPVERGSVGAMAVAQGTHWSEHFVPYVYRGSGVDTLTPDFETEEERADRIAREKARVARAVEKERKRRAARLRSQAEERERRAQARAAEQAWRQASAAKADAKWVAERRAKPVLAPSIRPSPGWKPMTGADIDDLLAEMEE